MLYQLMNKNTVVATYKEEKRIDDFRYTEVERVDPYLPYGFIDINDWIDGRAIAKHRTSIEKLMRELGLTTRHDFIGMIHCLSLTDTFWMKREDEALTWDDVSLYRNPFDDVIARIAFDGTGMYGRQNSPTSPEFATSGSFAKCWIRENGQISLLKRGSTGYANAGFDRIPRSSHPTCSTLQKSTTFPIRCFDSTKSSPANAPCSHRNARDLSPLTAFSRVLSMSTTCLPSPPNTALKRPSAKWS